MVVVWIRDSCLGPAEIAPLVFLVSFKDGGHSLSPTFYLFVSDVNQGNQEVM